MKNTLTYLLSGVLAFYVISLKAQDTIRTSNDFISGDKNLIKINLTAIPLNNYSFQYERAIGKKMAVVIGVRFMPEGSIPLKAQVRNLIDDEDLSRQLDNFQTGNYAVTPEIRFYMGKEVFKGFYIAPFVRYATYTASIPFEYEYDHPVNGTVTEVIPLKGELSTLTGGLLFGSQWKLSKLVYLDWWILGPQYGTSDGNIKGTKNLSADEQEALREELEGLEDLPLVKATSEVNSQGARVDFKGPWAGVRAGICLGFRF